MLGLVRHTVSLAQPADDWPMLFHTERQRIAEATGDAQLTIEHVGSTAVQGLPAKPILDIAILLELEPMLGRLKSALQDIGYIDRGDRGSDGGHLFVRDSQPNVRTHHVHVVRCGDPAWTNYLCFRDALRASPELKRRYAALKRRLAAQFSDNRAAYTESKAAFIQEALVRAHAAERDSL